MKSGFTKSIQMNAIKTFLAAFLMIPGFLNSHAQIQKTFGFDNSDDYGKAILKATDSNFYLIGRNSFISKTDTSGKIIWQKQIQFGEGLYADNDVSDAIITDSKDLVILGSYTGDVNERKIFISRFNLNGDTIWTRSYGNPLKYCTGNRIIKTTDGGYALIGSGKPDGMNFDMSFIKTDSTGKLLYSRRYGGKSDEFGTALAETDQGDLILVGNSYSTIGGSDILILKINSLGDTIWTKTIIGYAHDFPSDIIMTSSNKFMVTGTTSNFGSDYYHDDDLFLLSIDGDGKILWQKSYGGDANENGIRLVQARDSNILVIGNTTSFGFGQSDLLLLKTDTNGDTVFARAYGGSSNESGEYILKSTKGYYLLGETRSFSVGGTDICLIQTDSLGNSACQDVAVHPSVFSPVWKEHSGNTISYGSLEERTEMQVSDVSIKMNNMCDCVPPIAKFETIPLDGLIFFNDLSTWPETWLWDLGEGDISSEQNPQHFYSAPQKVCLTVQNECGSDMICDTVSGGGAGLKDNLQSLIMLFPNPAGDYIYVTCEENVRIKFVYITDILGNVALKVNETDRFPLTINTSSLSKGVYLIRFMTFDHIIISKKIVIE
jgi:hypothetical protein